MPAANVTCTADALDNYIFPTEGELLWPEGLQITGHLIFLLWLFVGVGLASDTFMNAIEAITSTQKTVRMKDGSTKLVDVWNPTVANLSLMALGSSAPEILLSCVELFTCHPVLKRTPRGLRTPMTGPTVRRAPASCMLHVPEAQGSLPRGLTTVRTVGATAMLKVPPPWQCPSSAPG